VTGRPATDTHARSGVAVCLRAGTATALGALPPEVDVADQTQDPEHPEPDPGEAGFGPGEEGESIEEGRKGEQGGSEQESGDDGES
jgi:hypothetical protein